MGCRIQQLHTLHISCSVPRAVVAADSPLGFVFHVFLTHAMSAEQKQDPDSQRTHLQKITKFRLLYILFKVNVDFPMKPKFFISSQKVWVVQLLLKKKIKKLFKAQKNQVWAASLPPYPQHFHLIMKKIKCSYTSDYCISILVKGRLNTMLSSVTMRNYLNDLF